MPGGEEGEGEIAAMAPLVTPFPTTGDTRTRWMLQWTIVRPL